MAKSSKCYGLLAPSPLKGFRFGRLNFQATAMIRLITFDVLHTLVTPRLPVYVQYAQTFEPFLGQLQPERIKASFKTGLFVNSSILSVFVFRQCSCKQIRILNVECVSLPIATCQLHMSYAISSSPMDPRSACTIIKCNDDRCQG